MGNDKQSALCLMHYQKGIRSRNQITLKYIGTYDQRYQVPNVQCREPFPSRHIIKRKTNFDLGVRIQIVWRKNICNLEKCLTFRSTANDSFSAKIQIIETLHQIFGAKIQITCDRIYIEVMTGEKTSSVCLRQDSRFSLASRWGIGQNEQMNLHIMQLTRTEVWPEFLQDSIN